MTRKATDKPAKGAPKKRGPKPKAKAETTPAATVEAAPTAEPVKAETKRGVGRPTKYDPAFCDVVLALGEEGKSLVQMAVKIGVLRQTMMEWTKKYPEFSDAVYMAMELSQSWWEDLGQKGVSQGRDFNGFAYGFNMKNRFKADYSDKIEVKHDATAAFSKIWQAVGTGKLEGATP